MFGAPIVKKSHKKEKRSMCLKCGNYFTHTCSERWNCDDCKGSVGIKLEKRK